MSDQLIIADQLLGLADFLESADPMTRDILNWYMTGRTGLSSKCMASALAEF